MQKLIAPLTATSSFVGTRVVADVCGAANGTAG